MDVALTVRSEVSTRPVATEDGARCALMNDVPLVVAGPSVLDPYAGFETCEQAAASDLVERGRRAEVAVAEFIPAASQCVPTVTVTRGAGGLRVHVAGLDALTPQEREAAIVHILTTLHVFDRSARTVDVEISEDRA